MSWKGVLSFLFFLLVVGLLTFYWLPFGDVVEFGVSNSRNSNFTVDPSVDGDMQFYQNMRYLDSEISYKIERCSIPKADEMARAFSLLENSTVLSFYEVSGNEEIIISCEETPSGPQTPGTFVAGEGGVTNVTSSGDFSVIFNGKVLLLRETQCANPIVGTHELLHALGFEHSDNPNNIMYPSVRCRQTLGEDIPAFIEWIYSFPENPDLVIQNASGSMQGRYLDLSLTIKNNGLADAADSQLIVSAEGDEIKDFEVEPITIGAGRIITLTNVAFPITKRNVEEIELFVSYGFEELDKNNNRVVLELKNTE